jgi:hypothetical protein
MKFKILTKKPVAQANGMRMTAKTSHETSKNEELKKEEHISVSGGPEVENTPEV